MDRPLDMPEAREKDIDIPNAETWAAMAEAEEIIMTRRKRLERLRRDGVG